MTRAPRDEIGHCEAATILRTAPRRLGARLAQDGGIVEDGVVLVPATWRFGRWVLSRRLVTLYADGDREQLLEVAERRERIFAARRANAPQIIEARTAIGAGTQHVIEAAS